MENTDRLSARLVRLPLWVGMDQGVADTVAREVDAL
jgi:dTDP-4-amino-4,6-dideoxygalactose transaminase